VRSLLRKGKWRQGARKEDGGEQLWIYLTNRGSKKKKSTLKKDRGYRKKKGCPNPGGGKRPRSGSPGKEEVFGIQKTKERDFENEKLAVDD